MTDNGLPCLDLLEATPGILRGLMSELTDDDARWKPAPDRFAVAEVLTHLSHSEGHCYRMRVDRFLTETRLLDRHAPTLANRKRICYAGVPWLRTCTVAGETLKKRRLKQLLAGTAPRSRGATAQVIPS